MIFALPLLGTACAPLPETGDLFLVAVSSYEVEALTATAAVDGVIFGPCDRGEVVEVLIGFRLNLLQPEPVPVPTDNYCDLGVRFTPDPFRGSIRLQLELADGTQARVALDPGLATRTRELAFDVETKGILALDLDLLLEPDDLHELRELPQPIDLGPDSAFSQRLASRVGDALVYLESPEVGSVTYVELWPRFDFTLSGRIDVEGCRQGPLIVVHPDASSDGAGTGDDDPNGGGTDPGNGSQEPSPRPRRGDGCSGGGCEGSSGCGRGGGCRAGCSPDCATVPLAPAAWAALVGLVLLRRRRGQG